MRSDADLIVLPYELTKEKEINMGHWSPGAVATVQSYLPVVRIAVVVADGD